MSESKNQSNAFNDLRSSFERLEVDEQARFLVEAALSLVANGAKEAGNVVSSVVEDLADHLSRDWCDEDDAENEAGAPADAAGPEAGGARESAGSSKKSTTRKSATGKGSTTRKTSTGKRTSTRKSAKPKDDDAS